MVFIKEILLCEKTHRVLEVRRNFIQGGICMPGSILVIRRNSQSNAIFMKQIPSRRGPLYAKRGFMLPGMSRAGMFA